MIEVEVKAKIRNPDEMRKKLKEIGAEFLKKENQTDRIFGHAHYLDSESKVTEGGLVARIRITNEKKILEFKEILRRGGGLEIQSELKQADMGVKLLEKLGFRESFTLCKTRESFSYDGFMVCIDNVKQLGDFMEIEKMIELPEEKEKARNACLNLLNKLSPDSKIESRKYGDLMQDIISNKKGQSKTYK